MKNIKTKYHKIYFFAITLLFSTPLLAQAPQAFKYQSIVRNEDGTPMANKEISIRATIKEASENGEILYQEEHLKTSNTYGLLNLEIGKGIITQGNFSVINWNSESKWLVLEGDFGNGYILVGASQLLSVPFALNVLPGPAGTNGTNGTNGIDGTNGLAGTNGTNGSIGLTGSNGTNGIDGTNGLAGTNGTNGSIGLTGANGTNGSTTEYAMFYGLTSGTGNGGITDYSATIAVKTGVGTGRIPFPNNGPSLLITRINTSSFLLPSIGTYEITYSIHTTEPGQIQLELNDVDLPETISANFNPTAGGHPLHGSVFITTTILNSTLALVNASGNAAALTITPSDGANTHANTQSITIKKIN